MTEHEVLVGGELIRPAEGWRLELSDPARGIGRLVDGTTSVAVLVEGAGSDWVVTLRGRRVPVRCARGGSGLAAARRCWRPQARAR